MEDTFTAVIRGKRYIKKFDNFFNSSIEKFAKNNERPKDLEVPDRFHLYYNDPPGYRKEVKGVFIYLGYQIRIKPRLDLKDEIRFTNYDSDTVYELQI